MVATKENGSLCKVDRFVATGTEHRLTLIVSCLLLGACISWRLGQDANWDLKNYHLYNAFAFLNGRFGQDLNPAGRPSYFNPLIDVPYYVLARYILPRWPRLVAALQGLPYGLLVYLCFAVNLRVFRQQAALPVLVAVLATTIGVTGAATISQIGTTFGDIQIAILVLAGILTIIPTQLAKDPGALTVPSRASIAGSFLGVAAALKGTAAIYAPAILLAACISQNRRSRRGSLLFRFCAGWAVAFLLLYGWWGYRVFELTHNPVFPMLNNLFRSDWYPPVDIFYDNIKPHGAFKVIFYPFYWVFKSSLAADTHFFRDARFACAFISMSVLFLGFILRHFRVSNHYAVVRTSFRLTEPARFIVVFVFVSYIMWLTVFGVLRYTVAIEVFTGALVVLAIQALIAMVETSVSPRAIVVSVAAVGITLMCTTIYPCWGRIPYGRRVFEIEFPNLPAHSLVILAGGPMAYVLAFSQAPDLSFVGITKNLTLAARGYALFQITENRVRLHYGSVFVLEDGYSGDMRPALAGFGIKPREQRCKIVRSNLGSDIRLCPASIDDLQ